MDSHIIADLLDRAALTSVGAEAALASQGSVELQDQLTRQARKALRDRGITARKPTPSDLLSVAAELRTTPPQPPTPPQQLRRTFHTAADWLQTRPYGPVQRRLGNDIVQAVETHAAGRARYDALTVIVQAVPSATITNWEWHINQHSRDGAVRLLRRLAENPPPPGRFPHPDAPPPTGL